MNKEEKVKKIMHDWKGFTDGVRVLFLIWRNKEGSKVVRNLKVRKLISRNEEEFKECLTQLVDLKERYSELPLRIYSTVNKRNLDKAIRKFKELQLENDYQDREQYYGFYKDIKNRWISSLMRDCSRLETQFIVDIDNTKKEYVREIENEILEYTELIKKYKTKNGYHLIVKPFNPNLIKTYENGGHIYSDVSLKKDDLILLDY